MSTLHERRIKARKARAFRRKIIAIVVIVVVVVSLGLAFAFSNRPSSELNKVVLRTTMGDITIQLYEDMPITMGNFRDLVKRRAYDGTIFHRVVKGFVVQGGDVTTNGITASAIRDELPNKHRNTRGSVAMAKTSDETGAIVPNSATSQFYINLEDNSADLDSNYSVFGTVIAGMNIVDAIGDVASDSNDKPLQDVVLTQAQLV